MYVFTLLCVCKVKVLPTQNAMYSHVPRHQDLLFSKSTDQWLQALSIHTWLVCPQQSKCWCLLGTYQNREGIQIPSCDNATGSKFFTSGRSFSTKEEFGKATQTSCHVKWQLSPPEGNTWKNFRKKRLNQSKSLRRLESDWL